MSGVDVNEIRSLYDEHGDALVSYFTRRVGRDLAEDLLADTFRAAIESAATFDADRGTTKTWLFGIGTNLLRRHWRTEQRRLLTLERSTRRSTTSIDPLLGVEDGVANRLDAQTDAGRLVAAVAALTAEDRDLLILSGWEHLNSTEIGEVLGLSAGAVRTRLHRLRTELRHGLDHPLDPSETHMGVTS